MRAASPRVEPTVEEPPMVEPVVLRVNRRVSDWVTWVAVSLNRAMRRMLLAALGTSPMELSRIMCQLAFP
jgi:hypothetical protein